MKTKTTCKYTKTCGSPENCYRCKGYEKEGGNLNGNNSAKHIKVRKL